MTGLDLFDALPGESPFWSVGELTSLVRELLQEGFGAVGVRGEVSNVARPRSGHVYFVLKDEQATLRAVMWKSMASRLVFDLEDGLAVRVMGGLDVYPPRGEYQLIVRSIEPEGMGALDLAFRQTYSRLAAEGLFDPDRKRPLPAFPRRIAIVTSPTGAAVRDLVQVLHRRWPLVEVLVVPVAVQGAGAAAEIAAGIALADSLPEIDVIITGRGGGSREDLWPFNEEVVARAIFATRRPVVSAVGHETDVTISDLVADVRALTPTDAAVNCVPDLREVQARLDVLARALSRGALDHLDDARRRLDDLQPRLDRAIAIDLKRRRELLARQAGRLEALSPLAVLRRGYSLTFRDDEAAPLRSVAGLRKGDRLRTRLADETIYSRVEEDAG
jgi:exodeoxyribonuclease VII large subunit